MENVCSKTTSQSIPIDEVQFNFTYIISYILLNGYYLLGFFLCLHFHDIYTAIWKSG